MKHGHGVELGLLPAPRAPSRGLPPTTLGDEAAARALRLVAKGLVLVACGAAPWIGAAWLFGFF